MTNGTRHCARRWPARRMHPATPDRTITEPTGESYGQRWLALSGPERHAWLLSQSIKVYGARADAGHAQSHYATRPAQGTGKSMVSRDGVTVVIEYPVTLTKWQMFSAQWEDEQA